MHRSKWAQQDCMLSIEVSNPHQPAYLLVKREVDSEERYYPDEKWRPATEKYSYALLINTQRSKTNSS